MPCLVLTGHPCSGKSSVAKLIEQRAMLLHHPQIQRVVIVSEDSACPDRSRKVCYSSVQAEKATRGALKAEFDRTVASSTSSTLVLLDSLNYIKGFRYELHCISKAAQTQHGIVWILNDINGVLERNSDNHYTDEQISELIQRYEPPDVRNRWDQPLYSINLSDQKQQDVLKKSVYNMHQLSSAFEPQEDVASTANSTPTNTNTASQKPSQTAFKRANFKRPTPKRQQVQDLANAPSSNSHSLSAQDDHQPNTTDSNAEAPAIDAPQTQPPVQPNKSLEEQIDDLLREFLETKPLQEAISTSRQVQSESNFVHQVDSISQQVSQAITNAQNISTNPQLLSFSVAGTSLALSTPKRLSLPELRSLRKQYMHWLTLYPPTDTSDAAIAESFVKYIDTQMS